MTKDEAYEKATRENLSDPKGTRMDIVYAAMEIYAQALFPQSEQVCSCCGSTDNHVLVVCRKCRNKW